MLVATIHCSVKVHSLWFGCVRYVDVLQFVELLHGPQSRATLTQVLAMVNSEGLSPASAQGTAGTSPQVTGPVGNARAAARHTDRIDEGDFASSGDDGSAEGDIRPFGLKGAKLPFRLRTFVTCICDQCLGIEGGCRVGLHGVQQLVGMLAGLELPTRSITSTP